jgi:hypothetical protein
LIRIFIIIEESVALGQILRSIGFMSQNIAIEIPKNFTLVERIFDQEQMLKC